MIGFMKGFVINQLNQKRPKNSTSFFFLGSSSFKFFQLATD